jgi:glutathione S-transferase
MDLESPIKVYGSSISYFTGKLENYFRIKGVAYDFYPMTVRGPRLRMQEAVGSTQIPAIEFADGSWMSDTTPIIQWFESNHPGPKVTPLDPLQNFFSLLLEDYADEWLWRPAMHYRWYYERGARFAGAHLAEELGSDSPFPQFFLRWQITRRQRQGFTAGDGIPESAVAGVEAIYLRTLEQLEAILGKRPFLLGDSPSLADIGFSGPMFRHFGLDPVPAEIMRTQAPNVYEWAARLWNYRLSDQDSQLMEGIPSDWGPILDEIGTHYLPYLCANNKAVAADKLVFDADVAGVDYRKARSSRYRVWCLARIRENFQTMPQESQAAAQSLLEQHGCWEPLWRDSELPMAPGFCEQLPFLVDANMLEVYQD